MPIGIAVDGRILYLLGMSTLDKTGTLTESKAAFDAKRPLPGLLVASCPKGAATVDRCLVQPPFTVGRGEGASLVVPEAKISKTHFGITCSSDAFFIEDLGSTNGTYVNKAPVRRHQLQNFDYIRIAFTDFKLVADKKAKLAKTSVILPDS